MFAIDVDNHRRSATILRWLSEVSFKTCQYCKFSSFKLLTIQQCSARYYYRDYPYLEDTYSVRYLLVRVILACIVRGARKSSESCHCGFQQNGMQNYSITNFGTCWYPINVIEAAMTNKGNQISEKSEQIRSMSYFMFQFLPKMGLIDDQVGHMEFNLLVTFWKEFRRFLRHNQVMTWSNSNIEAEFAGSFYVS